LTSTASTLRADQQPCQNGLEVPVVGPAHRQDHSAAARVEAQAGLADPYMSVSELIPQAVENAHQVDFSRVTLVLECSREAVRAEV